MLDIISILTKYIKEADSLAYYHLTENQQSQLDETTKQEHMKMYDCYIMASVYLQRALKAFLISSNNDK